MTKSFAASPLSPYVPSRGPAASGKTPTFHRTIWPCKNKNGAIGAIAAAPIINRLCNARKLLPLLSIKFVMLEFKDSDVFVKSAKIFTPDRPVGPIAAWVRHGSLQLKKGHVTGR